MNFIKYLGDIALIIAIATIAVIILSVVSVIKFVLKTAVQIFCPVARKNAVTPNVEFPVFPP